MASASRKAERTSRVRAASAALGSNRTGRSNDVRRFHFGCRPPAAPTSMIRRRSSDTGSTVPAVKWTSLKKHSPVPASMAPDLLAPTNKYSFRLRNRAMIVRPSESVETSRLSLTPSETTCPSGAISNMRRFPQPKTPMQTPTLGTNSTCNLRLICLKWNSGLFRLETCQSVVARSKNATLPKGERSRDVPSKGLNAARRLIDDGNDVTILSLEV